MNRIFYCLSLLAIVSLSCNLVSGLLSGPALVEATGPILGMTISASLDELGRPVDVSFTVPADQPEIVVLVRIGEVAPGPLTFSWFRVIEAGDQALFEQTVAVEAWDAAFSTGLNPGILAAGTYKVVATFAGQSETIIWDVAEPQMGDLNGPVGTSQSAEGGTPAPGPSGTTTVVVPEPGPQGFSGAQAFPLIWEFRNPPFVAVEVNPEWWDPQTGDPRASFPSSFTFEVSAAITGLSPGPSRQFIQAAGPAQHSLHFNLDPCSLPGGSDLPGTSITVTAFPLGHEASRNTDTASLGADTSRPIVDVKRSVESGQRVNPGEQIAFTVTAEELISEGSWQTGIWVMQWTGAGDPPEPWSNPDPEPQACDSKTRIHTETFTYTVPPNQPTINLCLNVQDFAGNSTNDCSTYYTADQLKGTLTSTVTTSLLGGQNIGTDVAQGDADLSLTLQADGTLTGTAVYTYTDHGEGTHSCGAYSESNVPLTVTLPVNGTWTQDVSIVFRFSTDTPIMVETLTTCAGQTLTSQHDVTNWIVGGEWRATWDGQAYAANEQISNSGADWTDERHWTIHLESPVSD